MQVTRSTPIGKILDRIDDNQKRAAINDQTMLANQILQQLLEERATVNFVRHLIEREIVDERRRTSLIAERDELREKLQFAVERASRKRQKIETVVDTMSAALDSMRDPA